MPVSKLLTESASKSLQMLRAWRNGHREGQNAVVNVVGIINRAFLSGMVPIAIHGPCTVPIVARLPCQWAKTLHFFGSLLGEKAAEK